MRFFVGGDENEIQERQKGTTAEHYLWCLSQLSVELEKGKERIECLTNFKKNMLQTETTRGMLEETEDAINRLSNSRKNIDKKEIVNTLSGLCIPEVGYITAIKF